MSESREKRISPNNSILDTNNTLEKTSKSKNNKDQSIYSKISPFPKPDFSSIEKKENSFAYKQKGSYKKPKSNVPESPMKSPNHKFFTPVKMQMKNLFGGNANTCRKLNFGEEDVDMNAEDNMNINNNFAQNFTEAFKGKRRSFLDKLDEEEKLPSCDISPDKKYAEKKFNYNNFYERLGMDIEDARDETESISFTLKSFANNNNEENSGENNQMDIDSNYSNYNNYTTDTNYSDTNFKLKKIETKFEKEFEVIKTLDAGAFGIVFKCRSKLDNKIYAVKKSKKHSSNYDYNIASNFINDVSNRLSHSVFSKFCVNYKECWMELEAHNHTVSENHLFITQEFCKYGDMLDYLEKVEEVGFIFNEDFYWDLIFEMMCGLHFIHECEFIHFDIKPGNFLIDEFGVVKLGDFGLSRKASSLKKGEDIFEGDSIYIAPEFFTTGNKKISNKVDVFSLGLSLLEILCKVELPQNGKLWKTIRSENFVIPEEFLKNGNIKINEKMINLLKKLLIINPEERPSIIYLLQSSEFEDLSIRYQNLMKNEYIRFLNPKQFDISEDDEYESASPNIYGKRSNSYKLDFN